MAPKSKTNPPRSTKPRIIADRFQIERQIGWGGGGTVYLAHDLNHTKQKVALKVAELKTVKDPALLNSLKNEFATLCLLRHRNLSRVYDFGTTEKEMYFSAEWIDGVDLFRATKNTHLNKVFHLIVQILRGIDYLHRRGVIHLDLKPANILVTDPDRTGDLTVKIIDFGIADWPRKMKRAHEDFAGSPPYAPPETILGQPSTLVSNIYSLGMIFHQILAGRFPYQSQEPFEIMKEQIYNEPLRIEDLNPALPADFSDVLFQMVAKKPEARFQSIREVLEAINRSLGETFTLRSPSAPIHILEESDYLFRSDLLDQLVESSYQGKSIVFSGPEGIGKSYLLRRVKETLQLQGIHPFFFQESESLSLSSAFHPNEILVTLQLPPLTPEQITGFLEHEIADFPSSLHGKMVADLSSGLPTNLEIILQSLREEGVIQWTDQGWRWQKEVELEFSSLLSRHATRWKERLNRVQEILQFSRMGLSAPILEGILGLEAGALEEWLKSWEKAGKIVRNSPSGNELYFSNRDTPLEALPSLPKDWLWMETELTRLYDRGEYASGRRWADLILSEEKKSGDLPQKVVLLCARHYVALGDIERALKILPSTASPQMDLAGLAHEIRTRIFFTQGKYAQAQDEILKALPCYTAAHDLSGLAALLTLKGLIFVKLHEFEKAEASYLEALDQAGHAEDHYLSALIEMNRGSAFHEQGRFEAAQSAYQKSLRISETIDHPLLACSIRHNLVNLLFYMGRAGEAEALCYDWLKLAIQNHYVHQQAASLNYLSFLAGQKDHKDIQLTYLNQGIGLLSPQNFPGLYAQLLVNRSYLFWDEKKFVPAQLDAEEAIDLSKRISNSYHLSLAHLILGKILRDRPRPDLAGASENLEIALSIASESRNRQVLWEVHFERGLMSKLQNEKDRAKEYFQEAKKALEAMLAGMPVEHRESYLRDRKLERIMKELESLGG